MPGPSSGEGTEEEEQFSVRRSVDHAGARENGWHINEPGTAGPLVKRPKPTSWRIDLSPGYSTPLALIVEGFPPNPGLWDYGYELSKPWPSGRTLSATNKFLDQHFRVISAIKQRTLLGSLKPRPQRPAAIT